MIGAKRRYYEETDSTNSRAKEWAKQGALDGSIVIADKQCAGRGRNGKVWTSPSGVGIWMSIILRPLLEAQELAPLTLITGLAMCEAIEEVTGVETKIKWPNDLVVKDKKLCGILCEMQATQKGVQHVIVGIGVNVNTEAFDVSLPYATSLYKVTGHQYNREQIIDAFCNVFEKYYRHYHDTKSFGDFKEKYEDKCITLNNKVKIIDNQQNYEAYAQHISEEGHLVILKEDGQTEEVYAGEVSVRGLYGYV